MSEVKVFIQGQHDAELFGLVGPWLTAKAVQAELGAAVTSEEGDVWHVCVDGGRAVGFALTRALTDGAHIKNIYAERNPAKTREQLLREVLKMLSDGKVSRAYTFARSTDELWTRNGFTFRPHAKGEFGTWEMAEGK